MRKRAIFSRSFIALLLWALVLGGSGIACRCTGVRRSLTPPTATHTRLPPTQTPTKVAVRQPTATAKSRATATLPTKPQPTATTVPTGTSTQVPSPALLKLVDPAFEDISPVLIDLAEGNRFQILFHENYLTEQVNAYLAETPELPIAIGNLEVSLSPGEVTLSSYVSLGFLRVEILARGWWRAVACRFEAEILEVRIAGQPAPASVREQVKTLLGDALKSMAQSPVCFSSVEIREGELEINGYRE